MLLPTAKAQKTTPKPTINRNFSQVRQYPIKTAAITALGNHHHAPKHAMHNAISGFVSIPSGEARTAFVVIQSVICSTTIAATEASTSGERVKRSGGSLRTSSTTPMIAASTAQPTPYQNKPRVPHTETIAPTIVAFSASLAATIVPSEPQTRGFFMDQVKGRGLPAPSKACPRGCFASGSR